MDKDEIIETYASTVKETILDEEKLVTYITISKDLCIHINNAKKLLQHVVESIRKEQVNTKLNVNYIVSGFLGENKAQTKVCSEGELYDIKKSFKIVFYDHIYSVSKGSSGIDKAAHLLLTNFDDFNICPGKITNSGCTKRSKAEIGNLKICSQEKIIIESKPLITPAKKSKAVPNKPEILKNEIALKNGIREEETQTHTVKSEPISPKKQTSPKNQPSTKTNGHRSQKGIAGFFNKPSITNNKKVSKETKEVKAEIVLKETIKDEKPMEVDTVTEKVIEKKQIKKEPENKVNNEVLNKIKGSSKVDKKRKRVLRVADSDSDTENDPFVDNSNSNKDSNDQSEDEIPPTPSANIVKITSGIVNPKKKRKIVDKTYTDEDGYILTKKEEVYESCSDNEEDVKLNDSKIKEEKAKTSPVLKRSPKVTKKKMSSPQKGKQTTLQNFFKKV